jgi:hypothetical protein
VLSDTDFALNALHSLSEALPDLASRPFDLRFPNLRKERVAVAAGHVRSKRIRSAEIA